MKKLFALLLCLVLCLSVFAACDNQGGTAEDTTAGNDTTAAPTDEPSSKPAGKKGCGASVSLLSLLASALAAAWVLKQRGSRA